MDLHEEGQEGKKDVERGGGGAKMQHFRIQFWSVADLYHSGMADGDMPYVYLITETIFQVQQFLANQGPVAPGWMTDFLMCLNHTTWTFLIHGRLGCLIGYENHFPPQLNNILFPHL